MTSLLHLAARRTQLNPEGPFVKALEGFSEPVELTIREQGRDLSDEEALALMREADVLLTMWGARAIPPALAADPGRVRYVLNLTGTCRPYVPIEVVQRGIPVTNWGDAPAGIVAEGAMALLLTVLKDVRGRTEHISAGEWAGTQRWGLPSGTLERMRLGLYGFGVIGRRFAEMVRPFGPELLVFDPYVAELPDGCRRVETLDALFSESDAVAIHAALCDKTRDTVTAERLAMLPDHGILINTARGEIVDQDALFAELKSGRLRAGLDVLTGSDSIPADHEARTWPNLILTCHAITSAHWPPHVIQGLSNAERIALDNLQRFQRGEELRFLMDETRYLMSS